MPACSALTASLLLLPAVSLACPGDCDGDGAVHINELVRAVSIALEARPLSDCRAADRNGDATVTVNELLAAVGAALTGCPPEPSPAPLPSTPTPPATLTPPATQPTAGGTLAVPGTPTATPTATLGNAAPVIAPIAVYRAYPGHPVALPIMVTDPQDDAVSCTVTDLPEGAAFGPWDLWAVPQTRHRPWTYGLTWTPTEHQAGPWLIPVTCTGGGVPPRTATAWAPIQVAVPDPCTIPICEPAAGCELALPPVTTTCCQGDPAIRVAEVDGGCPAGRAVFVGRNTEGGVGRLQTCDRLRVINFLQAGAVVRFNVAARCFDSTQSVTLHAALATAQRELFDGETEVRLQPAGNGSAERLAVSFPVGGPTPFYDLGGAEANLTVTLTDAAGATARTRLRLTLTFDELPDLSDR